MRYGFWYRYLPFLLNHTSDIANSIGKFFGCGDDNYFTYEQLENYMRKISDTNFNVKRFVLTIDKKHNGYQVMVLALDENNSPVKKISEEGTREYIGFDIAVERVEPNVLCLMNGRDYRILGVV